MYPTTVVDAVVVDGIVVRKFWLFDPLGSHDWCQPFSSVNKMYIDFKARALTTFPLEGGGGLLELPRNGVMPNHAHESEMTKKLTNK